MKPLTRKAPTTIETATIATIAMSLTRLLGCAAFAEAEMRSDSDSNRLHRMDYQKTANNSLCTTNMN